MVFAHLLHFTHHVSEHSQSVHHSDWSRSPDFSYWNYPLVELAGLTLGIVGLGRIGRRVAKLGLAMGMKVICFDVTPDLAVPSEVTAVDLDTLFRESDVVSLHCPLTADNRGFVSLQRLETMKPTAFLLNTSRGPLIDEAALVDVLNRERIAGAGLDVLCEEPPRPDNPLLHARNCTITPHIAWATKAARQRLMDVAVANVRAFLSGTPQNVVS